MRLKTFNPLTAISILLGSLALSQQYVAQASPSARACLTNSSAMAMTAKITVDTNNLKASDEAEQRALKASATTVYEKDSDVGKSLNLPVCEWHDPEVQPKAVVFGLHGATLYSKTFEQPAQHLAAQGYLFYALDMRGFGRWKDESSTFGGDSGIHYTQTKVDIEESLGMLRRLYPHLKIYILGESLGANMAVWLLTNKPELADGAILSSPCIHRYIHFALGMLWEGTRGYFNPYRKYDLRKHIEPFLSEDPRITAAYMADPMINRYFSAADLIKSVRTNKETLIGANAISSSTPILAVAGMKDRIYKTKAIAPYLKTVGSERKTIYISPNKGHLLLETQHTDPKILEVIDTWLSDSSPRELSNSSN